MQPSVYSQLSGFNGPIGIPANPSPGAANTPPMTQAGNPMNPFQNTTVAPIINGGAILGDLSGIGGGLQGLIQGIAGTGSNQSTSGLTLASIPAFLGLGFLFLIGVAAVVFGSSKNQSELIDVVRDGVHTAAVGAE